MQNAVTNVTVRFRFVGTMYRYPWGRHTTPYNEVTRFIRMAGDGRVAPDILNAWKTHGTSAYCVCVDGSRFKNKEDILERVFSVICYHITLVDADDIVCEIAGESSTGEPLIKWRRYAGQMHIGVSDSHPYPLHQ